MKDQEEKKVVTEPEEGELLLIGRSLNV